MAGQKSAVFGVFKAPSQADKAVSRLTSAGFSNSDVSLVKPNIDGLFSGVGIRRNEVVRYEAYAKAGGILLSVHCSNTLEIDRANIILEETGAERISCTDENAFSVLGVPRP